MPNACTIPLLDASALMAAANTRMAQVLEHGNPPEDLLPRLQAAMEACRAAQLALCDAIQPVPPGRDRVIEVTASP